MTTASTSAREPRESVFLSATVTRFGGGEPTRHRVRNLSSNGACIDQASLMRAGETVLIDVGTLAEVGATVRWVQDDLAGLRFAQPVTPSSAKTRPKPAYLQQGWTAAVR